MLLYSVIQKTRPFCVHESRFERSFMLWDIKVKSSFSHKNGFKSRKIHFWIPPFKLHWVLKTAPQSIRWPPVFCKKGARESEQFLSFSCYVHGTETGNCNEQYSSGQSSVHTLKKLEEDVTTGTLLWFSHTLFTRVLQRWWHLHSGLLKTTVPSYPPGRKTWLEVPVTIMQIKCRICVRRRDLEVLRYPQRSP